MTSSGGANTTAVAETIAFELAGTPSIGGGANVAETGTAVAPGGNRGAACFIFACVLRTGAKASAADHPGRFWGSGQTEKIVQMRQRENGHDCDTVNILAVHIKAQERGRYRL